MNIMKYRTVFFAISLIALIPSIISLFLFGLRSSIDFTGGSVLEVAVGDRVNEESLTETIKNIYGITQVRSVGQTAEGLNRFIVEGESIDNNTKLLAIEQLQVAFGDVNEVLFEVVGPTISQELVKKTLTAIMLAALIITIYVWRSFQELKYGVCAIIAMLHDSLVLLGIFSLLGYFFGVKVDILFVTALLTTLSFSVHDTIVVYDRIRELRRKRAETLYIESVNIAVLETLSRSLNNSITIIIMLLSLVALGGETIRWFAVALLVGAITGTYSSTFTAAPLLLLWDEITRKIKQKR